MFLFLEFKPVPGAFVGWDANLAASLLVVVFGFLFVTVSSRIVGLVGSSASPVSGMTIATLMATCGHLPGPGLDGSRFRRPRHHHRRRRLHRRFQLRRHLAGPQDRLHRRRHATPAADRAHHRRRRFHRRHRRHAQPDEHRPAGVPRRSRSPGTLNAAHPGVVIQPDDQQAAQRIFHVVGRRQGQHPPAGPSTPSSTPSDPPSCRTANISTRPPRGRLRCTGFRASAAPPRPRRRPSSWPRSSTASSAASFPGGWSCSASRSVIGVELLGIRSLTFAVGAYLPIGTTLPIFIGGVVRWFVDQAAKRAGEDATKRQRNLPRLPLRLRIDRRRRHRRPFRRRPESHRSDLLRQPRPSQLPHTFLDNN